MASSAESSAAGGMRKAPSLEWRWVSTEEEDDEDRAGAGAGTPAAVGAVGRGGSFESEDDEDDDEEEEEKEKGRKRLIRTVPSVDWFDVEGNEVSVAQQLDDSEVRGARVLFLLRDRDGFPVLGRLQWPGLRADLLIWRRRISGFVVIINQVGEGKSNH